MSNTSPSPDSNSPMKSPDIGRSPSEGTELDLWDLDTDLEENISAEHSESEKEAVAVELPSRRVTESSIQSRRPTERHIDPPIVADHNALESATEEEKVETEKSSESDDEPATTSQDKQEDSSTAPASSKSSSTALTKTEKIGLFILVAILALGATVSIIHFSNKVPTKPVVGESLDLPVEGKLVKITALSTYWREPILTGSEADTVRRGTKLIPVLKISAEAQSASIRVFFRDENGLVIGDPINRTVKGKTELRIPATAGFEDIGMHAAYRTGESQPWLIQILEAENSGAAIEKFKLIVETEISTDVR